MSHPGMIQVTPYSLPPLVGFIVLIMLSGLVFSRRVKGGPQFAFVLINLAAALWNMHIFLLYSLTDLHLVAILDRFFQPVSVLIPLAWVNFVTVFTENIYRKRIIGLYLILGLILFPFSPTKYFIIRTVPTYFGYYGQAGPLYIFFVLTHLSALVVTTVLLFLYFRRTVEAVKKNQILYILMANVVMGALSADNFFPLYGLEKYPLGNIAVIVYMLIIALAIKRHRFMDLHTIVRQSLIYSVATFLLTALYLIMILMLEGLVRIYLLPQSLFIPLVPALIVAFMFQGVKERVQARLDALFGQEKKMTSLLSSFSRAAQTTRSRSDLALLYSRSLEALFGPLRVAFFTRDLASGRWRTESVGGLGEIDLRTLRDNFLSPILGWQGEVFQITGRWSSMEERWSACRQNLSRAGFTLAVPLRGRNMVFGYSLLGQKAAGTLYNAGEITFIKALSGQAAAILEAREHYERWKKEERFTALGRASATISHELRNPLSIIKGAVVCLKKRYRKGEIARYTGIIGQEIERTSLFIEKFLKASRLRQATRRDLDVGDFIRRFTEGWSGYHEEVALSLELPEREIRGHLDPLMIHQLLDNLCRNAAEAMGCRGSVCLSLGEHREEIVLSVKDSGPGIEPARLESIFDPFFTTKERGSGLGLTIVDGVVRAHRGYIEVETAPGEGTTFKIFLPAGEKGDDDGGENEDSRR